MNTQDLVELCPDSGRRLPTSVVYGLTTSVESKLPIQITMEGGRWFAKPTSATALQGAKKRDQKLKTLGTAPRDSFALILNNALLGSSDYPILNAALGTAVGVGTGGASLFFTVATTALSMAQMSANVLARDGDEVWRVEEIGKVTKGTQVQPTYVLAYFLVDPYRRHSGSSKGWLLHEDRYELRA